MKTAELIGRKLDEWVARAEGHHVATYEGENGGDVIAATVGGRRLIITGGTAMEWLSNGAYHPSTDPKVGQPIMERYRIGIVPDFDEWEALRLRTPEGRVFPAMVGPTMLVAGMRALVASVYGEEVPE